MRRLLTFLRLPLRRQLLFAEAMGLLLLSWGVVRLLPFRWYARRLGRPAPVDDAPIHRGRVRPAPHEVPADVRAVRATLRRLERAFPVFTCLMRALAAHVMLRRRGYDTALYLGVRREAEDASLGFHAWLRQGPCVITGGGALDDYAIISMFA